jgi:hypothetical protein
MWEDAATTAAALDRALLGFVAGDWDELLEGSGAEDVALEAIDRACDDVVVDVTVLEVVET